MLDVTLIGFGAVGRTLFARVAAQAGVRVTHVVVHETRLDDTRRAVGDAAQAVTQVPAEARLVVECAGAYGFVMGSNYNSKQLAAEVLIQDGTPHLVRRRQTFEDLVRGESIPAKATV